jgi:hypothetical protein
MKVTNEVMLSELKSCVKILSSWCESIEKGAPGIDYLVEGGEMGDSWEELMERLSGELMIVAGKCTTLASVIEDV